jgi:hypothetical protein
MPPDTTPEALAARLRVAGIAVTDDEAAALLHGPWPRVQAMIALNATIADETVEPAAVFDPGAAP